MALEHVQQEILHTAEDAAKKILADAKEQVRVEMEHTHTACALLEKQTQELMEKEEEMAVKRMEANKKLIVRKVLLEKKKELLEETFAETKKVLQNMPRSEKVKILRHLFDTAKKEMSIGTLYVGSQDKEIVNAFGIPVQQESMLGGLIAENKEGTVRTDYSFDALLQEIEEKRRHDVAALLCEGI